MGVREIAALALCLGIWLPIAWGLWVYRERKSEAVDRALQAYATLCAILGIWLGLSWFRPRFPLFGTPRYWVLGLLPGVGILLLMQLIMPGKLRKDLTWQYVASRALRYLIPVGLLEEVWFRGVWFACFRSAFFLSVVLGTIVFALIHLSHCIPNLREGLPDVVVIALVTMPLACARYNGAGVVPLAVGHGVLDLFLHALLRERQQRYSGIATITLGIGGCALLTGVTFLW